MLLNLPNFLDMERSPLTTGPASASSGELLGVVILATLSLISNLDKASVSFGILGLSLTVIVHNFLLLDNIDKTVTQCPLSLPLGIICTRPETLCMLT